MPQVGLLDQVGQNSSTDPVLNYMRKIGLKITPKGYLEFNYPDGIPEVDDINELLPVELQEEK